MPRSLHNLAPVLHNLWNMILGEEHQALIHQKVSGAQGRNRTTDTAIFSRMLYQLSYLGVQRLREARVRRRPVV